VGDRAEGAAVTGRVLIVPLAVLEGSHLAHLVDEFNDLLQVDARSEDHDPGLTRLTPDVYPDDPEASRAFAAATHDDLLDRRSADAAVVRAALDGFDAAPAGLSEEDALAPRDVVIPEHEIDAWLRTLTALRLVIAERLGIAGDDDLPADDPRRGVYDWLGFRLETLIQSADELG
jgi:hypothetical protein